MNAASGLLALALSATTAFGLHFGRWDSIPGRALGFPNRVGIAAWYFTGSVNLAYVVGVLAAFCAWFSASEIVFMSLCGAQHFSRWRLYAFAVALAAIWGFGGLVALHTG